MPTQSQLPTRHGDLVIYPIAELPPDLVEVPSGVIRRGSSDGSDHILTGGRVLATPDGTIHLDVEVGGGELRHVARHTTTPIAAGAHVVRVLVIATDAGAMPVED